MLGFKPETVIDSEEPATDGDGSPVAGVAEVQFKSVIVAVEYLMS